MIMALRQLLTTKTDMATLRQRSRVVDVFDDRLGQLIDDMIDTMEHAGGVGLAAVQVGILRRVCVLSVKDGVVHELVNPNIVSTTGAVIDDEGCLSIPGQSAKVQRPQQLVVEALDRYGKKISLKAKGLLARAICHEIDHMDGVLYVDKKEQA